MESPWEEEIHGFASPGEYARFVMFLESWIAAGNAKERPVDPAFGKGMVYGGRWFENPETNEMWRLVEPDPPFRGLWQRLSV